MSIALSSRAAANDDDRPVDVAAPATNGQTAGPSAVLQPSISDELLLEATNQLPGFAGAYVDGGELVVWSTEPERMGAAGERASLVLSELDGLDVLKAMPVRVEPADFTFRELFEWSRTVTPTLLAWDDAVYVDINEKSNRVEFGSTSVERATVLMFELVKSNGVPGDALSIVRAPEIRPDSLQSQSSALVGGIRVTSWDGLIGYTCSLGFTASVNGTYGFFTNSHCTPAIGHNDLVNFYQPLPAAPSRLAGRELIDPPTFSGGQCPLNRVCRYSDATFVGQVAGSLPVYRGLLARPYALNDPHAWAGAISPVTGSQTPLMGFPARKIGSTTGQTEGSITATCVTANAAGTNNTYVCQTLANYSSAGGDSGGVVMDHSVTPGDPPSAKHLLGIHWGAGSGVAAFSPVTGIAYDFAGQGAITISP